MLTWRLKDAEVKRPLDHTPPSSPRQYFFSFFFVSVLIIAVEMELLQVLLLEIFIYVFFFLSQLYVEFIA